MNDAQKAKLLELSGWEVQNARSGPYLRIACILPDGRVFDQSSGPAAEVVSYPEGTIMIGMPAN